MKYYLHDTSSFDDEKITELFINFGYEGLGLFYTIIEKIAKQEKPIKTHVLRKQLRVGKRLDKCWTFMEEIDLISSSNGETFNENILNFSEKYQIKKEKTRKRVSEWRDKQADSEDVTGYECVSNARKVKESKVKEEIYKEETWKTSFDNVFIVKKEYETLVSKHGKKATDWMIEKLSSYKLSSGKKYKSDYGAINSWVADKYYEKYPKVTSGI